MKTLVLTGGGTLGHCNPCLSIAKSLVGKFDKIVYIGSETGPERKKVEEAGIPYYPVTTVKFKRELALSNFTIPFKLFDGVRQAERLLKQLSATVVFSKGGYVSLPVAIAAGRQKVPLILHESDISLGLANKLCARYATEVFTTFKETAEKLSNGIYSGALVSEEIFGGTKARGYARYNLVKDKPVLLVLGGSSGSVAINLAVEKILPKLLEKYSVLHLTGSKNAENNLNFEKYENDVEGKKSYVRVGFESQMKYAYAVADVAVTRGGSNCLSELIAMKIPALIIPLPKNASRGDQIQNAEYYKKQGAFRMLLQENITDDLLLKEIDKTYENRLNLALSQQKLSKGSKETVVNGILAAAGIPH